MRARGGRPSWRSLLGVVALAISVLAQGERCELDPLLRTPGSALASYWEAVQNHDIDRLWACSATPPEELPYPGMTWCFPTTRALSIEDLRYVPLDADRVVVSYRVRFRVPGSREERALDVSTELVEVRGEWRVTRPLAEAGLLNGRSLPTRFDI